jgi:hypothetical protein
MIKESNVMADLHRIRERFYQKTKKLSHGELLKLIKSQSKKVEKELSETKPDSELVIRKKYRVPESAAMKEIHQIRERQAKYGKF